MAYRKFARGPWSRLGRIVTVLALVFVSSYCTKEESPTLNAELTPDETYLVETYVKLADARDLHAVNYLKSESLFTVLDSTTDSLRIANTIRDLNLEPERWLVIFRSIEQTRSARSQGTESEQDG
jgi:hypothetical protein